MNGSTEKLKENAFKICREFLEGAWETVPFEDFQFDVIQGGMSNKLYRCGLPEGLNSGIYNEGDHNEPKQVLLRIYGPQQDEREVVIQEVVTFAMLSGRNLGPKLYGVFSEGRLEEYIPSRALDWEDLVPLAVLIAKEFAKIHSLKVPIRKTPVFQVHLYDWLEYVEKSSKENFLDSSHDILESGEYRREVKWLIDKIVEVDPPVVFCHNDLQGGNILLMDPPGIDGRNIMFIDFEFGGYNYRGFDIGNHFNERCFKYNTEALPYTYDVDPKKYPSQPEQIEFIEAYLNQLQEEGIAFKNDLQTERTRILKEILILRLASHLYWAAWAFKMHLVSSIPFPYKAYGNSRYGLYKMQKQELLEEDLRTNAEM